MSAFASQCNIGRYTWPPPFRNPGILSEYLISLNLGHSPEMSSTPKTPKIGIRTPFWAIYLHQMVQYVVSTCSSYLALSEYVTYKWIALIFLCVLRF